MPLMLVCMQQNVECSHQFAMGDLFYGLLRKFSPGTTYKQLLARVHVSFGISHHDQTCPADI